MIGVGDMWPVWWDTGDGKPAGQHEARILDILPYDGPEELGMTHILRLEMSGVPKGYTEMSVALPPEDMHFRLGNCLRGHFEGWFTDVETAWKVLSQRFLLSYPVKDSSDGRHVQMYVFGPNSYGHEQWNICKDQKTCTEQVHSKERVLELCTRCSHYA